MSLFGKKSEPSSKDPLISGPAETPASENALGIPLFENIGLDLKQLFFSPKAFLARWGLTKDISRLQLTVAVVGLFFAAWIPSFTTESWISQLGSDFWNNPLMGHIPVETLRWLVGFRVSWDLFFKLASPVFAALGVALTAASVVVTGRFFGLPRSELVFTRWFSFFCQITWISVLQVVPVVGTLVFFVFSIGYSYWGTSKLLQVSLLRSFLMVQFFSLAVVLVVLVGILLVAALAFSF